jgi:tetratricopeptide (TPR) repeat protein
VTVEFQDHSGNSIREALGRSTEPDPPRYPVGHVLPVLYNPDKPKDFRAYPVTGFEIGEPEISVSPKPLWLLSIALSAGWLIWFLVPRLTSSPLQHFNRGNALLEKARLGRGDWNTLPTAIEEYRRAVRLRPDWAEAHYYLGKAFENKKDWDAAIREYQQAIRLKPDSPEAHLVLGNALYRRGDQEGAIAEYREALRLKPDFAPAHNNLGVVLEQKGDQQAALDEYRKASELDPKHPGYRAAYDKLRKELNR